ERAQVVAPQGQAPAVEVASLERDRLGVTRDRRRLLVLLEGTEVEDHLGRARDGDRLFAQVDLAHHDRHRHAVELGQLPQPRQAQHAVAAFVGTHGGGAPATARALFDVLERKPLLSPNGAQAMADLLDEGRALVLLVLVHVGHGGVTPLPALLRVSTLRPPFPASPHRPGTATLPARALCQARAEEVGPAGPSAGRAGRAAAGPPPHPR